MHVFMKIYVISVGVTYLISWTQLIHWEDLEELDS